MTVRFTHQSILTLTLPNFFCKTIPCLLNNATCRLKTGTKWIDRIYGYKIIQLTTDTISLKNNYNYSNPRDTFFFVNIDNLKEATSSFKFLLLQYSSPWSGKKQITIDSLGKVTFVDKPIIYSVDNPGADKNAKPKNILGQLTPREFENFKNVLANSLPSRLPLKRGCPMDEERGQILK